MPAWPMWMEMHSLIISEMKMEGRRRRRRRKRIMQRLAFMKTPLPVVCARMSRFSGSFFLSFIGVDACNFIELKSQKQWVSGGLNLNHG